MHSKTWVCKEIYLFIGTLLGKYSLGKHFTLLVLIDIQWRLKFWSKGTWLYLYLAGEFSLIRVLISTGMQNAVFAVMQVCFRGRRWEAEVEALQVTLSCNGHHRMPRKDTVAKRSCPRKQEGERAHVFHSRQGCPIPLETDTDTIYSRDLLPDWLPWFFTVLPRSFV